MNICNIMSTKQSTNSSCVPAHMPKMKKKVAVLKTHLHHFSVLQVYGPPLSGKSTIVHQALDDMNATPGYMNVSLDHMNSAQYHIGAASARQKRKHFHIHCKGLMTFHNIIIKLASNLNFNGDMDIFNAVSHIYEFLNRKWSGYQVVFVFHKCEFLRQSDQFDFWMFMYNLNRESNGVVRSVFTTYKQFPSHLQHRTVGECYIEMMDDSDISDFFRFYFKSETAVQGYVQMIMQNNLCFPLGVRHVVEVFLQDHRSMPAHDVIEIQLRQCWLWFLSDILHDRGQEVKSWISVSQHKWIALFCQTYGVSICDKLVKKVLMSQCSNYDVILNSLERTFVIIPTPGCNCNYIQFHPLLVYHLMMEMNLKRLALEGVWFNISSSKVVKFLCQVLCITEEVSQLAGHKSAIYQCLAQEWSSIRNTLHMAIHCNHNTFKDFCKVAFIGAYLLVRWLPTESVQFFQTLHGHAVHKGFKREAAILQGLMAHAIHLSCGSSQRGQDWDSTNSHFQSSIQFLEKEGPSFYLAQLYSVYGRALNFQNEYKLSLMYAIKGKAVLKQKFVGEKENHMFVTVGRIEDLKKRLDINEAMPLIFLGRNKEARQILHENLLELESTGIDHSTLCQVFNLMGLVVEREGIQNLQEALKYYQMSLNERLTLEKFCPTGLLAPLNNIAMVYADKGDIEAGRCLLLRCLDIQRNNQWNNYYTALTLLHLSEICLMKDELHKALEHALQAQEILDAVCNKHDLRLHLCTHLAHLRLAIDKVKRNLSKNCLISQISCVIEMADGSETAEEYFESVFKLGNENKNNLSDYSHYFLLSALEHLLLLNWGNLDRVMTNFNRICDVFATYPWVVEELNKGEAMNPRLAKHYVFLLGAENIFREGHPSVTHNFDPLLSRMLHSCKSCVLSSKYFDNTSWTIIRLQYQNQIGSQSHNFGYNPILRRPGISLRNNESLRSNYNQMTSITELKQPVMTRKSHCYVNDPTESSVFGISSILAEQNKQQDQEQTSAKTWALPEINWSFGNVHSNLNPESERDNYMRNIQPRGQISRTFEDGRTENLMSSCHSTTSQLQQLTINGEDEQRGSGSVDETLRKTYNIPNFEELQAWNPSDNIDENKYVGVYEMTPSDNISTENGENDMDEEEEEREEDASIGFYPVAHKRGHRSDEFIDSGIESFKWDPEQSARSIPERNRRVRQSEQSLTHVDMNMCAQGSSQSGYNYKRLLGCEIAQQHTAQNDFQRTKCLSAKNEDRFGMTCNSQYSNYNKKQSEPSSGIKKDLENFLQSFQQNLCLGSANPVTSQQARLDSRNPTGFVNVSGHSSGDQNDVLSPLHEDNPHFCLEKSSNTKSSNTYLGMSARCETDGCSDGGMSQSYHKIEVKNITAPSVTLNMFPCDRVCEFVERYSGVSSSSEGMMTRCPEEQDERDFE